MYMYDSQLMRQRLKKIAMCDILCRKKNKQTKHVNQCVHTVSVCGQIGEMY